MLSCGVSMLFSFFMPPGKSKERMGMTMEAIVEEVQKKTIDPHEKYAVPAMPFLPPLRHECSVIPCAALQLMHQSRSAQAHGLEVFFRAMAAGHHVGMHSR
jgi:hypothetical protein